MPKLDSLCLQHSHCPTCRAAGGDGPAWREGVLKVYAVPAGWPAAVGCIKGLALGWEPAGACGRCGANWHATDACPIDPDATPARTADALRQGGCCGAPAATPGGE